MKKFIKITSFVIVVLLALSLFGETNIVQDVNAKTSKDVTATQERNIKKLCRHFTNFLCLELIDVEPDSMIKVGKSKTWKFQNWRTEDLTYKENMLEPLTYMYCKNAAEKVFDIKDWKITPVLGDWGDAGPYISLKSIKKVSSKKYKATFNIKWENSVLNKVKKMGSATFTLKKKRGTYYGFIVKSVTIKKISNRLP